MARGREVLVGKDASSAISLAAIAREDGERGRKDPIAFEWFCCLNLRERLGGSGVAGLELDAKAEGKMGEWRRTPRKEPIDSDERKHRVRWPGQSASELKVTIVPALARLLCVL